MDKGPPFKVHKVELGGTKQACAATSSNAEEMQADDEKATGDAWTAQEKNDSFDYGDRYGFDGEFSDYNYN